MGGLFFTDQPVTDFDSAQTCDTKRYGRYFHAMLEEGVYLAPSQFEAYFVSAAHGADELAHTLNAQRRAFEKAYDPDWAPAATVPTDAPVDEQEGIA